jgi:hypothetical protein
VIRNCKERFNARIAHEEFLMVDDLHKCESKAAIDQQAVIDQESYIKMEWESMKDLEIFLNRQTGKQDCIYVSFF